MDVTLGGWQVSSSAAELISDIKLPYVFILRVLRLFLARATGRSNGTAEKLEPSSGITAGAARLNSDSDGETIQQGVVYTPTPCVSRIVSTNRQSLSQRRWQRRQRPQWRQRNGHWCRPRWISVPQRRLPRINWVPFIKPILPGRLVWDQLPN
jgi:hypothetical protein